MTTQPTPVPEDLEQFSPNIKRYWLYDHRVVVHVMQSFSRKTIDEWAVAAKDSIANRDRSQPYIVIHDLHGMSLTPYARQVAKDVAAFGHDLYGHTIAVVYDNMWNNIIALFLRVIDHEQRDQKHTVCTRLDEAFEMAYQTILDFEVESLVVHTR